MEAMQIQPVQESSSLQLISLALHVWRSALVRHFQASNKCKTAIPLEDMVPAMTAQ